MRKIFSPEMQFRNWKTKTKEVKRRLYSRALLSHILSGMSRKRYCATRIVRRFNPSTVSSERGPYAGAVVGPRHLLARAAYVCYRFVMSTTIKLTPAQEAWLEAQVASGQLPSIEHGVRSAVADLMAISNDDLAWAKPYVVEARASVARGDVSSGEAVLAHLRTRIAQLRNA